MAHPTYTCGREHHSVEQLRERAETLEDQIHARAPLGEHSSAYQRLSSARVALRNARRQIMHGHCRNSRRYLQRAQAQLRAAARFIMRIPTKPPRWAAW